MMNVTFKVMVFPADSILTLIHKARQNAFVGGDSIVFSYLHCFVNLFINCKYMFLSTQIPVRESFTPKFTHIHKCTSRNKHFEMALPFVSLNVISSDSLPPEAPPFMAFPHSTYTLPGNFRITDALLFKAASHF